MNNLFETITPVQAIEAMIAGLKENAARDDFMINMYTFGESDRGIRIGCAATCALERLHGSRFTPRSITYRLKRAEAVGAPLGDVRAFELAINYLRLGCLDQFFAYFGIDDYRAPAMVWRLNTDNWKDELPKVEAYLRTIKRTRKYNLPRVRT